MAAGFGSLRRFNDTFQTLFKRPPTALRRAGGAGCIGWRHAAKSSCCCATAPHTTGPRCWVFCESGRSLAWKAWTAKVYRRTIGLEGQQGTGDRPARARQCLEATVRFPRLVRPAPDHRPFAPGVRSRRRSGRNRAATGQGPGPGAAGRRSDRVCACRAPGTGSNWRCVPCSASRSRSRCDPPGRRSGRPLWHTAARTGRRADPCVSRSRARWPASIRPRWACRRSRGAALLAVAAAVMADPHIFAAGRSLDEAVAQLRALPGIGEWTAQYIAMRQLREPDAFPAADIGLMRAMADPRVCAQRPAPCWPGRKPGGPGGPMPRSIYGRPHEPLFHRDICHPNWTDAAADR